MKLFKYSFREPGNWRGFLMNGRCIEVAWGCWQQLALELTEGHLRIAIPGLAAYLPYPGCRDQDDIDVNNTWAYGFYVCDDHFSAQWGRVNNWLRIDEQPKRTLFIRLPWRDWQHVRHDVLSEPETHPYRYVLLSGEAQIRDATIQVEEREWRLLHRLSPIKLVKRYIDVTFSDEVGEKTGSWKGGTIGCGYDMISGERPIDTLRRMEREQKF